MVCLQETHLNKNLRFTIRGYQSFRKDRESGQKGGVLTLVSNAIPAEELSMTDTQESEIIGVKLTLLNQPLILYNCYAPPNKALILGAMDIPTTADCIVVGGFNSHFRSWGYKNLDTKGEELEDW